MCVLVVNYYEYSVLDVTLTSKIVCIYIYIDICTYTYTCVHTRSKLLPVYSSLHVTLTTT